MTKFSSKTHTPTLFISFSTTLLFFSSTIFVNAAKPSQKLSLLPSLGLNTQEKLSHLHFYFHDVVTGPNPTAIWVAQSATSKKSPTLFGSIAMFDDPLTIGPKRSSKMVGRAQGIYGSASQSENALLVGMNLAFVEGKFNGSSLTVLGRNPVAEAVREMPIVGGSGRFRFARGYAQARTLSFNATSGDALVQYNVFVFHY